MAQPPFRGSSGPPPSESKIPPVAPKALRTQSGTARPTHGRLLPPYNPYNPSFLYPHPRHPSNPVSPSPLQNQMFPTMPASSQPSCPPRSAGPGREARSAEQTARPRGESRSSSVPILRLPQAHREESFDEPHLRAGSYAPPPALRHRRRRSSPEKDERIPASSVKHLTCFWWKEKGFCKFTDEQCLYAHYDTGRYTDAPRKVFDDEPAKAGKSLERALNKLAISNRSSSSLPSGPRGDTTSRLGSRQHSSLSLASMGGHSGGDHLRSHSQTPFNPFNLSRSSSPAPLEIGESAKLRYENAILQDMILDMKHDKLDLMDTVNALSSENAALKEQLAELAHAKDLAEKERNILAEFHGHMAITEGAGRDSPLANTAYAGPSPFGPVGSRRIVMGPPASHMSVDPGNDTFQGHLAPRSTLRDRLLESGEPRGGQFQHSMDLRPNPHFNYRNISYPGAPNVFNTLPMHRPGPSWEQHRDDDAQRVARQTHQGGMTTPSPGPAVQGGDDSQIDDMEESEQAQRILRAIGEQI